MAKIKECIKGITLNELITLYIVISPIIDLITSIQVRYTTSPFSIGALVRWTILGTLVVYTLIKVKDNKKEFLIFIAALIVYALAFIVYYYTKYGAKYISIEITGLLKTYYYPVNLLCLIMLNRVKRIKINSKAFNISLAIYSLAIVIPYVLGISEPTYSIGFNEGFIGFFYAGNDIGTTIVVLSIFLFAEFISKKITVLNTVTLLLAVFSSLYIGTKSVFIGFLALSLACLIICVIVNRRELLKNITLLVIFVLVISIVKYTPVGKNIDRAYINPDPELTQDTDVFSGRWVYKEYNEKEYLNSNITEKLLGNGYVTKELEMLREKKLVEMDEFDIFFGQGIIGTMIYIVPLLYVVAYVARKLFEEKINRPQKVMLTLGLITIATIGLGSGHCFIAPPVSSMIIITVISLINRCTSERT